MRTIKCLLILPFFFIDIIFLTSSFSKDFIIPNSIEFELSNSEYNKYLRRSMEAYTDGEIYGKKILKKNIKSGLKLKL